MWDFCGMSRNKDDLEKAILLIKDLKEDFWKNVTVPGKLNTINLEVEKAGRVADLIELGEVMMRDALDRNESCGGHFRDEYQTKEGEALRDDEKYNYVSAWEYKGNDNNPKINREKLIFSSVAPTQRSYK